MVTIIQGDYAKITTRLSKTFKNEYFDFNFSFTDENEVFREINRFIWESKHLMTRFKNRYYGSVAISLSEWNNETPNGYFDSFMFFMKDMFPEDKICFYVESQIRDELLIRIKLFFPNTKIIDLLINKKPERRIGFAISDDEIMEGK